MYVRSKLRRLLLYGRMCGSPCGVIRPSLQRILKLWQLVCYAEPRYSEKMGKSGLSRKLVLAEFFQPVRWPTFWLSQLRALKKPYLDLFELIKKVVQLQSIPFAMKFKLAYLKGIPLVRGFIRSPEPQQNGRAVKRWNGKAVNMLKHENYLITHFSLCSTL